MRNLKVVPVSINGMPGFQVQGIDRACSDSLWEPVAHAAVFRDEARAQRFLAKVQYKPKSWEFWGVPANHVVSPIDAFKAHVAPFSVL